jgi:hypothetical protein
MFEYEDPNILYVDWLKKQCNEFFRERTLGCFLREESILFILEYLEPITNLDDVQLCLNIIQEKLNND